MEAENLSQHARKKPFSKTELAIICGQAILLTLVMLLAAVADGMGYLG